MELGASIRRIIGDREKPRTRFTTGTGGISDTFGKSPRGDWNLDGPCSTVHADLYEFRDPLCAIRACEKGDAAMMNRRTAGPRRAGVATVEAAVVLAVLLVPVIIGVWEVGRLVYAQQVVTNAAREGARLAAQGRVINRLGTPTEIDFDSGTPNIKDTVYQALVTGGLSGIPRANVTIKFAFDGETPSASPTRNPYQGIKSEKFRIFVSVPWEKVRWVNLGLVNPTTVEYTVDWQMLVDDPFSLNVDLPKW